MSKQVIIKNGQVQGNNGQALSLQNLQPENIKKDVNIGGVVGTMEVGRQVIYGTVSISGNEVNKIILNDIPSEPQTLIFYSSQQTGAYANLYIKNENYPNHYITSYSNTYTFSRSLPEQKIYYTYENGVLTIRNNALKYFRNTWYYILIL